jgi:hypothetical protein
MYYIVVLREQGAAYYAASIPGVPGLPAFPFMRLLGVDSSSADATVYGGVHQSVLGQIGFRVDTRVYRAQVAQLPEFSNWYGSAQGADTFTEEGALHLSDAQIGGQWIVQEGSLTRTDRGMVGSDAVNRATLQLSSPAGFLNIVVKTTDRPVEGVALIWRAKDNNNFWCFEAGSRQCRLSLKQDGKWSTFPSTRAHYLVPNASNSLQICDDGESIALYVNGELVYSTQFSDARLQDGTGAGIQVLGSGSNGPIHSFEAHPRTIPIPTGLNLGEPWFLQGNRIVVKDDFAGPITDLAERTTSFGGRKWRKAIGTGVFELTGNAAAKVLATVEKPCPGRTAYTIDWATPSFADIGVTITPPNRRPRLPERGRGGLIFWQDDRNYITLSVFMDDWYGTSIAAFFYVDGVEELYDAVWANVGRRIYWGTPYDFRVVFDGKRFLAFVNGEPVLYRALSDIYPDWDHMQINRTGVVVNWEWGNDTGSVFQHFIARERL